MIRGHLDFADLGTEEEPRPRGLRVIADGFREGLVVHRGIRLRPNRPVAPDVWLVATHVLGGEEFEFGLLHPVREAPFTIRLEPRRALLARRDLERADRQPGK